MKGEIEECGFLCVERAGKMAQRLCALKTLPQDPFYCSHHCVAFREPVRRDDGNVELQLCHEVGVLVFDEFEDKREVPK